LFNARADAGARKAEVPNSYRMLLYSTYHNRPSAASAALDDKGREWPTEALWLVTLNWDALPVPHIEPYRQQSAAGQ
jgi:hypothetical protein